jgi:hypothetical protein
MEPKIKPIPCSIIWIDGYWNDTKNEFHGFQCTYGFEWDLNEDDNIFYYFEEDDFDFETNGNYGDFTMTAWRQGDIITAPLSSTS